MRLRSAMYSKSHSPRAATQMPKMHSHAFVLAQLIDIEWKKGQWTWCESLDLHQPHTSIHTHIPPGRTAYARVKPKNCTHIGQTYTDKYIYTSTDGSEEAHSLFQACCIKLTKHVSVCILVKYRTHHYMQYIRTNELSKYMCVDCVYGKHRHTLNSYRMGHIKWHTGFKCLSVIQKLWSTTDRCVFHIFNISIFTIINSFSFT